MFSLDPFPPAVSGILEILARNPGTTTAKLHETLEQKYQVHISLQHLYRLVTQMVEDQILLKIGGGLSLNLLWISYVEYLTGRAKEVALQHVEPFPLTPGDHITLQADSLHQLETLWHHTFLQIETLAPQADCHVYHAHAWWELNQSRGDKRFIGFLANRPIDTYVLYGSTSFLDTEAASALAMWPRAQSTTTDNPPFPAEGCSLMTVGDYLFECVLPAQLQQRLAAIFHNISSHDTFDNEAYIELINSKEKCSLKVIHNAEQTEVVRSNIAGFFR